MQSEVHYVVFSPGSWLDFLICIVARFKWRIIIKSVQICMFTFSSSLIEVNPDFRELCETEGVGKSEFTLLNCSRRGKNLLMSCL